MEQTSGVGVVDKVVQVLDALEAGPAALAELVTRTGLARPTAYRIAVALERHRYVERDGHLTGDDELAKRQGLSRGETR